MAELASGCTSLMGFQTGVVPVPGGTTPAGTITLRTACDGEFDRDLFGTAESPAASRAMQVYDSAPARAVRGRRGTGV